MDRRLFLTTGFAALSGAVLATETKSSENREIKAIESAQVGCLVDTTLCIGCRKCEEACNRRNNLPRPENPFTDQTVFRDRRRPTEGVFTVVNEYPGMPSPDQKQIGATHCKVQCMHCLTPACVSACLVGAMTKLMDGSVVYNKSICLGCRYCMVACPFEIPAYEFSEPLKPKVRKCEFCADYVTKKGANPACAAACPTETLVFGKRQELLALARSRIKNRPDRYLDYIYGEYEAGGTSWLYLTGRPMKEIDLVPMPGKSPAVTTESIQHGIFKFGIIPMALYGFLAGVMWKNRKSEEKQELQKKEKTEGGKQ